MKLSKDMNASDAIPLIGKMNEAKEITAFVKGDDRKTVVEAADDRKKELKEATEKHGNNPDDPLKKQISDMQIKHSEILGQKDTIIDTLQTENDDLKRQLTEALENEITAEKREEIRQEVLQEVLKEQERLKAENAEEEEEEEKAPAQKVAKHFTPEQMISLDNAKYEIVINAAGWCGAWTEERLNINLNLFKMQNIKTHVVEIPEENRNEQRPGEHFLLYRAVTVAMRQNVEFKG